MSSVAVMCCVMVLACMGGRSCGGGGGGGDRVLSVESSGEMGFGVSVCIVKTNLSKTF